MDHSLDIFVNSLLQEKKVLHFASAYTYTTLHTEIICVNFFFTVDNLHACGHVRIIIFSLSQYVLKLIVCRTLCFQMTAYEKLFPYHK